MKERLYENISKRIQHLFGIHLKENNWSSMEKNLMQAAKLLNRKQNLEEISEWMLNPSITENEYHALAKTLTIGETYFFRELSGLSLLSDVIIPAIRKNDRKALKIWSAGCSSGEEPYSIAIFLKENLPDANQWDIHIMATDLNNAALNKARKGIYRPWSFRGFQEDLLSKYFVQRANTYEIRHDIREMITFSNLNLVNDDFPMAGNTKQGFDAIFCRNVLMYLSNDFIETITKKFFNALSEDSWLITSQTELSLNIHHQFRRTKFKDAFFFKKGNVPKPQTLKSVRKKSPAKIATANQRFSHQKAPFQMKPVSLSVDKTWFSPYEGRETQHPGIRELYINFEYQKCINFYQATESSSKIDIPDLFLVSKSYANLGQYAEAAALMEEIIDKNSSNPEFYYFYATILSEQGSWQKAERNLVKALYLKPDFLPARFSYFLVLKKRGKHKNALKEGQNLLNDINFYDNNEVLPDMEGMTAGSLRQTIDLMQA